jgi:hypothetical protein
MHTHLQSAHTAPSKLPTVTFCPIIHKHDAREADMKILQRRARQAV